MTLMKSSRAKRCCFAGFRQVSSRMFWLAWAVAILGGCASQGECQELPPSGGQMFGQFTLRDPMPAQHVSSPSPEPENLCAPKPVGMPKLTLDQTLNTCLMADPKLRAGFQAVNQANGDALSASLLPNPQLYTDGQLLPLDGPFTPKTQGGPTQQDANLIFPIDWFVFGKRTAAMASATIGVHVSQSEYADLVRQRVLETAVAFYDVLEANALLDLARRDVQNLEAVLHKAEDEGSHAKLELNRVRLDLLSSKRLLRDAESTVVKNKAHLRSLLGQTEIDPDFDVAGSLDVSLRIEPLSAKNAFTLALQNRPDIGALRSKVDVARANTDTEQRKAYPTVTTQVGYTRQYQGSLGFPDANSWNAAVTMAVPLFDRNQGNRAKATSVVAQAQEELRLGEVALRAEVESAVQDFCTARANAESVAQEQLKLAAEVRDSINQTYEAGGCPLIDMLDAQRDYRDTYRLYISSRADYWRAFHKLNAVVGKQVAP